MLAEAAVVPLMLEVVVPLMLEVAVPHMLVAVPVRLLLQHRISLLVAVINRRSIARLRSVNRTSANSPEPQHNRQSRLIPQRVRGSEPIPEYTRPALGSPEQFNTAIQEYKATLVPEQRRSALASTSRGSAISRSSATRSTSTTATSMSAAARINPLITGTQAITVTGMAIVATEGVRDLDRD